MSITIIEDAHYHVDEMTQFLSFTVPAPRLGKTPGYPGNRLVKMCVVCVNIQWYITASFVGSFVLPQVGQHTVEVLKEISYADEVGKAVSLPLPIIMTSRVYTCLLQEIKELLKAKVIYQSDTESKL